MTAALLFEAGVPLDVLSHFRHSRVGLQFKMRILNNGKNL